MEDFNNGDAMKWRIRQAWYPVFIALAIVIFMAYDYFHSLGVVSVNIDAVTMPTAQPFWREIKITLVSNYPEYPFVPSAIRRFFRIQPIICFANANGTELINEDIQNPCILEVDGHEKRAKSHHMEKSEFRISVNLQASRFNDKRLFLRQLREQGGVWVKFSLGGYIFPPTVVAEKLAFVDLTAACKRKPLLCKQLGGERLYTE